MYTYGELLDDVNYLSRYGVETGCIGASVYGRLIPYVALGNGAHAVLVTAGIHAREHVSALFAVKQIYKLRGQDLPCRLYFVPMVNPDGNVLAHEGADAFGFDKNRLLALNGGNADFSLWKANAAGVDLNVNFNADWGAGKQNVRTAGSANYIGAQPFSEPETRALAEFTRKIRPVLTVSYHAKGREIYYDFGQTGEARARDRSIAQYAAECTGYSLIEGTQGSAGGYKDWCVAALGIPALTLELVADAFAHPLPDASIAEDFARAYDLPVRLYGFMRESGYV
ncbi:MAG: hypothetical protein K2L51_06250 [Clostridiales bacterium]|nr:hypothetical protein [Clostridiales bacterium]